MRVLHVINPGPLAGAERVVLTGAAGLRSQGVDARLAVLVRDEGTAGPFLEEAARLEIPTQTIPWRFPLGLKALELARELCGAADLVHAHGYAALSLAHVVRAGRPIVSTLHGATRVSSRVVAYEALERTLAVRSAHVFCVSSELESVALKLGGDPQRIERIHNPIEVSRQPSPPSLDGGARLVFAGRLSPEKGLDLLLLAVAMLPPDARPFVDVLGDGPHRAALERLANSLGLGTVRFHGWVDDVPARVGQAHGLVLPSRSEGLPLAVLEAAAIGRPVLAARVGALPQLADEGGALVLVEPDDAAALSAALRSFVDSLYDHLVWATQAREVVRVRYGAAAWAVQTKRAYARVLQERRWTGSSSVTIGALTLRRRSISSADFQPETALSG
jgi:glycosyltransferase involved in cell wall biosynthesis